MDYIVKDDTIIFSYDYNKQIDLNLISLARLFKNKFPYSGNIIKDDNKVIGHTFALPCNKEVMNKFRKSWKFSTSFISISVYPLMLT